MLDPLFDSTARVADGSGSFVIGWANLAAARFAFRSTSYSPDDKTSNSSFTKPLVSVKIGTKIDSRVFQHFVMVKNSDTQPVVIFSGLAKIQPNLPLVGGR